MKAAFKLGLSAIVIAVIAFVAISTRLREGLERYGIAGAPNLGIALRKVRVGGQRFAIPENYIVPPLQVTGRDGEYDIVRAIFINGLTPTLEPVSLGNEQEFHKPLCCIRVLVTPTTIVHGSETLPKLLKSWFSKLEIIKITDEALFTHYEVRSPGRLVLLSEFGDVYVRNDHQEVTMCNRRDVEHHMHIVNIECHVYSAGPSELYQISVPNNDELGRQAELTVVRNKLHSWMK